MKKAVLKVKIDCETRAWNYQKEQKKQIVICISDLYIHVYISTFLQLYLIKFDWGIYCRYLKLNLNASDQAKEYNTEIPLFLRNRPKPVVNHCMKRWKEAETIPSSDIDELGNGCFLVNSQSNTILAYHVNLRCETDMPSCDCIDWKTSHLPCKHMMCIFQNYTAWNWNALPEPYRLNPFISLDLEDNIVVPIDSSEMTDHESPNATEIPVDNSKEISSTSHQVLPLPSRSAMKTTRSSIISKCSILKDMIYCSEDLEKLKFIDEQVHKTLAWLQGSLQKEGNILLNSNFTSTTKKTKKRVKIQIKKRCTSKSKKLKSLPRTTRKKSNVSGRHGHGAEMKRKHRSRKGIQELLPNNDGEDYKYILFLNIDLDVAM